jgi:alkylated DNA repair protein (DNA oxidative demethylase)
MLLGGFASAAAGSLLAGIAAVASQAPFRHMATPGGRRMSVAMTNCGALGWVTDARGYRYAAIDPDSGLSWPALPAGFADFAADAASAAGVARFSPDACLINRYEPGARMAPHQDIDETDFSAPIVSISLGMPAIFLWGGLERGDPKRRVALQHGDVVVWGGPARKNFHGIAPLTAAAHPATGAARFNITFRKARDRAL